MSDDMKTESIVERRFIGADGEKFDHEWEALRSLAIAKLESFLLSVGGPHYEFDAENAARKLVDADAPLRWLSVARKAREDAKKPANTQEKAE